MATNKAPAAHTPCSAKAIVTMPSSSKRSSSAQKATTPRASAAVQPAQAKRSAIAKAQAIAPQVPARIGSTPSTTYRGNPDIFGRLVEDHDRHRALLAMLAATRGNSPERNKLFKELTLELQSHAAAEEQALWATVMRNPATTGDARHAVAEHKEIDDMLADLAARDMASSGWLRRFAALREEYLHHIAEEEQEQFVAAEKQLSNTELRAMKQFFQRRKHVEKATVKIKKKLKRKD